MSVIHTIETRLQTLASAARETANTAKELAIIAQDPSIHDPNQKNAIEVRVDKLAVEVDKLAARIEELKWVRGLLHPTGSVRVHTLRAARWGVVRSTLLELLAEAPDGLTVRECVDGALDKGVTLNLNSVGATLSSLKKKGKVLHTDWHRYQLARFAEPLFEQSPALLTRDLRAEAGDGP